MANDQKEQKSLSVGGTPIFAGKTALIRFVNAGDSNSSSIWLAERGPKVIRPFVSEEFFDSMFANPQQAQKAVVTMSSDELGPEGVFKDYKVLDEEHGVKPDGSMKPLQFSPAQVQKRYGQPINPEAENQALSSLDGLLGQLTGEGQEAGQPQSPEGIPMPPEGGGSPMPESPQPMSPEGIPEGMGGPGSGAVYDGQGGPATLHTYGVDTRYATTENEYESRLKNLTLLAGGTQGNQQDAPKIYWEGVRENPEVMGFYIGAMAYGGYTEEEVYAELVRMYKAEKDPTLYSKTIINPEIKRSTYITTDEGKAGQKYFETAIPATSGMGAYFKANNGSSFLNKTALAAMPNEIFQLPPEIRDQTDASFKEDAAKIKEAYWDGFIEKIKANTVAEDALADSYYRDTVDEIEKRYGMKMSDDTETAEQQLKNLDKNASMSGALGGEEYTRARKEIQKAMKKAADRDREAMTKEKDAKEFEKVLSSGTPEEIAAFKASHPDKASTFDVPEDLKAKFTPEQMRIDYPTLSEDERQELRDTMFDQNGNRRSTLWTKYYQDKYDNMAKMRAKQVEDLTIKETKAHNDYLKEHGMEDETDLAGNKTGRTVPIGTNARRDSGTSTYDQQVGSDPSVTTETGGSQYIAKPAPTVSIQKGSTDQASIKQLQDYLVDQGYMTQAQVDTGYGTFGPQTTAALTAWQKANGVGDASSWGNWGPLSISKAPTAIATATAPVNQAKLLTEQKQVSTDVNQTALQRMKDEEAKWEAQKQQAQASQNVDWDAITKQQEATARRQAEEKRLKAIVDQAEAIKRSGYKGMNEFMAGLPTADRDSVRGVFGSMYTATPQTYTPPPAQTYTPPPAQTYTPPPAQTYTPPPAQNSSIGPTAAQRAAANAAAGLSSSQSSGVSSGTGYNPSPTPTPPANQFSGSTINNGTNYNASNFQTASSQQAALDAMMKSLNKMMNR